MDQDTQQQQTQEKQGATKFEKATRVTAIGLAMVFGSMAIAPSTAAQEAQDPVAAEEDEGFDDWGLLGLLGLAGLAGLKRREPEVRRVDTTRDTVR